MKTSNATKVVASTLGILVGLAGIDHGIFEIMQGNVAPDGAMIEAIGPAQRFWEHGTETALTIVPSFVATGILAVLFGLLVTIWSAAFVHRRGGAIVLLLLSIVLFLVGGGFAPIVMALLASLAAARIRKPLTWPRGAVASGVRRAIAVLWPWVLSAFVLLFVFSVTVAIFGWPLTLFLADDAAFDLLNTLSLVMVGLMVLSVLAGLVHDAQVPESAPAGKE